MGFEEGPALESFTACIILGKLPGNQAAYIHERIINYSEGNISFEQFTEVLIRNLEETNALTARQKEFKADTKFLLIKYYNEIKQRQRH